MLAPPQSPSSDRAPPSRERAPPSLEQAPPCREQAPPSRKRAHFFVKVATLFARGPGHAPRWTLLKAPRQSEHAGPFFRESGHAFGPPPKRAYAPTPLKAPQATFSQ